jgi:hypothetical protein
VRVGSHVLYWQRRQLLQVGAAGMFGLSLPKLLGAASGTQGAAQASCIFVMLDGGPSHIDTFDPKPLAPAEIRGALKPIGTSVPGTHICEKLPRLARIAHRYCLIRSMSQKVTGDHIEGTHATLSGQSDGSSTNNTPYFGSVLAKVRPSAPDVPSYAWLHNLRVGSNIEGRHESGGLLGASYAPMRIGRDLDTPAAAQFRVHALSPPEGSSTDDVKRRYHLLRGLDEGTTLPNGSTQAAEFQKLQARAVDLVTSPQTRRAFDLEQEPRCVREAYGLHQLGQYMLLARRLIEAGVRVVSLAGCPGPLPGDTKRPLRQVWDMHDVHFDETGGHMFDTGLYGLSRVLPLLDQALAALLNDLQERGLLETTLVVLVGEFGRTPRLEAKGRGRGHWKSCYTALLAGAGVRGGMVYGASDHNGAYVARGEPISPETFGATIYHALGVPPELRPEPRNLAYRVSNGQPLLDIFEPAAQRIR